MTKAVIHIGYTDYIMDAKDALQLAEVLTRAERYQRRGYADDECHYVWQESANTRCEITIVTDELYDMAKLAGKPNND